MSRTAIAALVVGLHAWGCSPSDNNQVQQPVSKAESAKSESAGGTNDASSTPVAVEPATEASASGELDSSYQDKVAALLATLDAETNAAFLALSPSEQELLKQKLIALSKDGSTVDIWTVKALVGNGKPTVAQGSQGSGQDADEGDCSCDDYGDEETFEDEDGDEFEYQ